MPPLVVNPRHPHFDAANNKTETTFYAPQIPPRSQACAGHLCSPSSRFAWVPSPAQAGVPSCASPPLGHPETAHRWLRTAGGYTAAPAVCLRGKRRAVAGPDGGSEGTCPPSWRCLRSWGSLRWCLRSTAAPSPLRAASLPPHGRYIRDRSLSSTSRVSRWKTSPLRQFLAPLTPVFFPPRIQPVKQRWSGHGSDINS